MGNLFAIAVAEVDLVPEGHADIVRLIGPVDRPEDTVRAQRQQSASEGGLVPITAGRDVKVIADVFERRLPQSTALCDEMRVLVEAVHGERKPLAEMSQDELKPWKGVEHA